VRTSNNLRRGTPLHLTALHQGLAAALLISLAPLAATAATIAVTSPDDTTPAALTTCTLRQAILSMNAAVLKGNCVNSGAAFGTGNLITFAASSVTGATPNMVTLADSADTTGAVGGTLVVTAANLTINASSWKGSGAGQSKYGVQIARPADAANEFGIVRGGTSSLTLTAVSLRQGKAQKGGGVCMDGPAANLTLIDSVVTQNDAQDGGGIYVNGSLTMTGGALLGNSADDGGGVHAIGTQSVTGAFIYDNDATYSGGGILSQGSLTLSASSVINNTADKGGGLATDTLLLNNTTVFGNSATGSNGGGMYVSGDATLTHATVVTNAAAFGTGRGIYGKFNITLNNTIVAGNNGGLDIAQSGFGTLFSNNSITSFANLNLTQAVFVQGPYGITAFLVPGSGSTAIDAVPAASCSLATDQRGVSRPQGTTCDVGAVEVQQFKLTANITGSGAVSAGSSPVPQSGAISNCANSCFAFYAESASVTLTATAATGSHFVGWTGDCANSATVTMSASRTCTATFALNTHAIGGSITNLAGSGLKLHLNYGVGHDEDLTPINGATTFAFIAAVPYGVTYTVSVSTQPANLSQTCNVTANSTGPMPDADVVAPVACTTNSYSVGGGVTGLTGAGLVLKLNGGSDLAVSGSNFTFLSQISSGSSYVVSVSTQPSGQTCTVGSGSGTVTNANISNVAVTCGAAQAQLTLSIDDGQEYARYGKVLTYLVTLSNNGAATANSIAVLASTPGNGLDLSNATWQCIGGGSGAVCAASGSGPLSDTVTLPVSRTLTWIVSTTVPTNISATTVQMDVAATSAATVSDVDTLVIYRDGFNVPNGGGTSSVDPSSGSASEVFSLPPSTGSQIETVKQLQIDNRQVAVQRIALGRTSYVRLLARDANGTEQASAWAAAVPGTQFVIGRVDGVVLLEGAEQPLELR